MRAVATAALLGIGALAGSTGAAAPSVPAATATLSTVKAGARPVALTIRFASPLRCGRPTGVAVVTLPRGAAVPAAIARTAVRVNERAAGAVRVSGHTVAVTLDARNPGTATCQSIVLGRATIAFAAAAGLGNPAAPGVYTLRIRHGAATYTASFTITASDSGLYGVAMRGPTKPVCEIGVPCEAPAPDVTIAFLRDGVVRGRVTTGDDGSYRIGLAPGLYALQGPRGLRTLEARVLAHRWLRLTIRIDTGIR